MKSPQGHMQGSPKKRHKPSAEKKKKKNQDEVLLRKQFWLLRTGNQIETRWL